MCGKKFPEPPNHDSRVTIHASFHYSTTPTYGSLCDKHSPSKYPTRPTRLLAQNRTRLQIQTANPKMNPFHKFQPLAASCRIARHRKRQVRKTWKNSPQPFDSLPKS